MKIKLKIKERNVYSHISHLPTLFIKDNINICIRKGLKKENIVVYPKAENGFYRKAFRIRYNECTIDFDVKKGRLKAFPNKDRREKWIKRKLKDKISKKYTISIDEVEIEENDIYNNYN